MGHPATRRVRTVWRLAGEVGDYEVGAGRVDGDRELEDSAVAVEPDFPRRLAARCTR